MAEMDISSSITVAVNQRSDLSGVIIIPAHNVVPGKVSLANEFLDHTDMASSITVVRTGKNDLNSTIVIPPNNKMLGKVSMVRKGQNDLASGFVIPYKGQNNIAGTITVKLNTTKAFGVVDVVQPPTITFNLTPVQDSFVRSGAKTLNYGDQQTFLVGYSDSFLENYRSLLQFDVSSIPSDVELTSVKLKLLNTRNDVFNQTIRVVEAANDWTEDGVTWNNQPFVGQSVTSFVVNQVGEIEVDMLDVVNRWVNEGEANHGIELRAYNEAENQYSQFFSKESNHQPVLEVTYHNPLVPSIGQYNLDSHMVVPFTSDLVSTFFIPTYDAGRDLHATIRVKEPNVMFGQIAVSRPDLPSIIAVQQSDMDDITASVAVRQSWANEQVSTLTVSHPNLQSQVWVPYRNDIPSQAAIRQQDKNDLVSTINVSYRSISGTITARQNDIKDIDGAIAVRQTNSDDQPSTLAVSRPDTPSQVYVLYRSDITAQIAARRSETVDMPSFGTISRPDMPAAVNVPYRSDIDSSVAVRRSDTTEISASMVVSHPDMTSTILVRYRIDIPSSLDVRLSETNDIPSTLTVSHPDLMSSAYVLNRMDTPSSIVVRQSDQTEITAHILANSPTLFSSIYVRFRSSLPSHIAVRQQAKDDLPSLLRISRPDVPSTMVVRQSGNEDVDGIITVRQTANNDQPGFIAVSRPDLPANITARQNDISEITGTITVRRSGTQDIDGHIYILHHKDIHGHINVIGASMLPSIIRVISGNLASKIVIQQTGMNTIRGTLKVPMVYHDDLTSRIFVPNRSSYAFIL